ncbi:MAG: DUF2911 domain-containing protein [Calditrichaeota bacterium]|nr:DUF2911 domain-containing protein [Calditrichota bacterium]
MRILIAFILSSSFLFSQVKTPQPSPFSTITQVVGITEIAIEYCRPGIKGRKIFGGLEPYGKVWRTGANEATKIKFSTDVTLEGNEVPAGEYSIYTVPGEREWKIIINKKLDGRQNHAKEHDLVTFKVKPKLTPLPVERFTIDIADITDNSANIVLMWAQTRVSFKMGVDTDKMVMESIKNFRDSDDEKSAGAWYSSARYYFENEKNLEEALEMVSKSLEINEKPFWVLRLKSQILAAKGDYEEAIVWAKRSLVSAQKAGNNTYIKMNETAISEWSAKL